MADRTRINGSRGSSSSRSNVARYIESRDIRSSCDISSSCGVVGGCGGGSRYLATCSTISFVASDTCTNDLTVFVVHTVSIHITFEAGILSGSSWNFVGSGVVFRSGSFI